MRVITAPTKAPKTIFLAGGISRCPDWQSEMIGLLGDASLLVFNPRRPDFDVRDVDASVDQINWEFHHLAEADAVLFWFPKETDCPITLYELGKWGNLKQYVFIGIHPEYRRKLDVEQQMRIARPDVARHIVYDLKELADEVIDWSTK